MIFEGDAATLAELTRPLWKAEWWPDIRYHEKFPQGTEPVNGWWHEGPDPDDAVLTDTAAAVIFAAAWVAKCEGFELYKPRLHWKGWTVVETWDEDPIVKGEGPSPLHAVLAAVEGVG